MKRLLLIFLLCSLSSFGQFMQEYDSVPIGTYQSHTDSKPVEYITQREFNDNLQEKYSDKDFQYQELEEEKEETPEEPIDTSFLGPLFMFIGKVFPFILGIIIVVIILKAFLGKEIGFWNLQKSGKKVAKKLIYEEEDIHESDFEALLQRAIQNKEYRLAIRYYYLSVLKLLSDKKLIEYHKDKTNSEYLFELADKETRSQFSYLSYVFTYVWYGEFPVDEQAFKAAERKYQSFKKSLK